MARTVLGIGTSHGPTMETPSERWRLLGEKDLKDSRIDRAVFERANPDLEQEITEAKQRERYDATQAAIGALAAVIRQAEVDTILVISNLHGVVREDSQTVFGLYIGEQLPIGPIRRSRLEPRDVLAASEPVRERPADPALARYLLDALIDTGFDVAYVDRFREGAFLQHEYTVMDEKYLARPVPLVPFMLSRYLPNQATPARCYALGQALREAIDHWQEDKRVAVVASGGLSHQVIDEELDRRVLAALLEKDRNILCELPRDRLNAAPGTPEILNWVALAGAVEDKEMTLVDYLPCYRSLYGTGHGLAFAYWQ
jgi:hypothetical protein